MSGVSQRKMYTVSEAAVLLGIGRSTAYDLIARNELHATRIGRRWMSSPGALEDLLGERPPPPSTIDTDPATTG